MGYKKMGTEVIKAGPEGVGEEEGGGQGGVETLNVGLYQGVI